MKGHKDLILWQQAMNLAKLIYAITADFPKNELYGLTNQMRRAAISVPSNLAEGAGRGGTREFRQFLMIARGSLSELETQVLLAQELGYIKHDQEIVLNHIQDIFKLMAGLKKSLESDQ